MTSDLPDSLEGCLKRGLVSIYFMQDLPEKVTKTMGIHESMYLDELNAWWLMKGLSQYATLSTLFGPKCAYEIMSTTASSIPFIPVMYDPWNIGQMLNAICTFKKQMCMISEAHPVMNIISIGTAIY